MSRDFGPPVILMNLTHLGPLFISWSIFACGFDFTEVFASEKTLRCHRYRGVWLSSVNNCRVKILFSNLLKVFPQFKETVSQKVFFHDSNSFGPKVYVHHGVFLWHPQHVFLKGQSDKKVDEHCYTRTKKNRFTEVFFPMAIFNMQYCITQNSQTLQKDLKI